MIKPVLVCSFSGGQTSAVMTQRCIEELSDRYSILVLFMNTAEEREETLIFVDKCDRFLGFNSIWLESEPNFEERKASGHKVVTFETASRNGEPFEKVIQKYGIPNKNFPHCTRELKLNPFKSYLASIGLPPGSYLTAVGIRTDEVRRVRKDATKAGIIYPLIDMFPHDKEDVSIAIESWSFRLELLPYQGNCKTCWKKSFKKLYQIAVENPEYFDFNRRMETKYANIGAGSGDRVFFRMRTDTDTVIKLAQRGAQASIQDDGCSESCEVFDGENEQ